jgi:GNAT superfamily N-acetyltransferase
MEVRTAGPNDVDALRRALLRAFNWEPSREPLPLEHDVLAPYRDGWGRHGDLGVVAAEGGRTIGAAYCRLVPGGYGFVDERTPEVTIGVDEGCRGRGIGTRLLEALARLAREQGFEQLSLSVEPSNPAVRLYERAGYRAVGVDDGGSVTMLKRLDTVRPGPIR